MRLFQERRRRRRLAQLGGYMDDLVRQHPAPQAVDEWFPYITLYAGHVSREEDQFCREYLVRRARAGYEVYDRERLK